MVSTDAAIEVKNISKCYRIGLKEKMHDSVGGAILDFVKSPVNNYRKYRSLYKFDGINPDADCDSNTGSSDIIWALRNVSFRVNQGEVLGIIGYKLDRKNKSYEKMIEISNSNIKMLEKAQGEFEVSGVDPIQVLIAWQKQILQLAGEVYKASGSGIGIAIDVKTVIHLLRASGIDIV